MVLRKVKRKSVSLKKYLIFSTNRSFSLKVLLNCPSQPPHYFIMGLEILLTPLPNLMSESKAVKSRERKYNKRVEFG